MLRIGHVAPADIEFAAPAGSAICRLTRDILARLGRELEPVRLADGGERPGNRRPADGRQAGTSRAERAGNSIVVGRVLPLEDVARRVRLDLPVMVPDDVAGHTRSWPTPHQLCPGPRVTPWPTRTWPANVSTWDGAGIADEIDAVVPGADGRARADIRVGPLERCLAAGRGRGRAITGSHRHIEVRGARFDELVGPHVGIDCHWHRARPSCLGPRVVVARVAHHVGRRGDGAVCRVDAGAQVIQAIVARAALTYFGSAEMLSFWPVRSLMLPS